MSKIAVVGAGPSGVSAGYHLAKNGHHVTLIDKESFPRDKACGDGITLKSVEALSTMDIDHKYLKKNASEFYSWNGVIIHYSGQDNYYKFSDGDFGFCIPRYVFDNIIYERAIEAGCISHKQSVSNISKFSSNFKNEFDYIIDARGILAGKCNAIAIREYWSLPLECFPNQYNCNIQVDVNPALGFDGYFWIFPVDLKEKILKLNVGIVLGMEGYDKSKINIIRLFNQFVVNHHLARKYLANVINRTKKKVYPLAIAEWNNSLYDNNVFKVGDAANLTDPLTAEGIANAIYSGFYLAQAINMSDNLENTKFNYQKLYNKHFQKEIRIRLLLQSIVTNPILCDLLIRAMSNKYFSSRLQKYLLFS